VILRNPVERAYSQYNMQARRGDLPSFEDAIGINGDDTFEAKRQFLARGRYAEHIERWLEHFPIEQFAFVRAEDFFEAPQDVMRDLHAFLALAEVPAREVARLVVGRYESAMAADTRRRLEDYFAEPNQRLATLLGRNFGW
jgi:hypothetical protein